MTENPPPGTYLEPGARWPQASVTSRKLQLEESFFIGWIILLSRVSPKYAGTAFASEHLRSQPVLNLPITAPSNGMGLPVLSAHSRPFIDTAIRLQMLFHRVGRTVQFRAVPSRVFGQDAQHSRAPNRPTQAASGLMMVLFSNSKSLRKRFPLLAGFHAYVNAPAFRTAFPRKGSGLIDLDKLRSIPLCVLASAFLCTAATLAQQAAPTMHAHRQPYDEAVGSPLRAAPCRWRMPKTIKAA